MPHSPAPMVQLTWYCTYGPVTSVPPPKLTGGELPVAPVQSPEMQMALSTIESGVTVKVNIAGTPTLADAGMMYVSRVAFWSWLVIVVGRVVAAKAICGPVTRRVTLYGVALLLANVWLTWTPTVPVFTSY